jgi:hypothetical protein
VHGLRIDSGSWGGELQRAWRVSAVVLVAGLLGLAAGCERLPALPESLKQIAPPASPTPNVQATVVAAVAATQQAVTPTIPKPSANPSAQFIGGFQAFHDVAPELIGEPLRNESSPMPGLSVQQTTNGVLIWIENRELVFLASDGRQFTWNAETRSLKVFGPS